MPAGKTEMDSFSELWAMAKQAGPFASVILLTGIWWMNEERKALQVKYDALLARFLDHSSDNKENFRELREMFGKALEKAG